MQGGTELQTLNLVGSLIKDGHLVTTLCYFEKDQKVVLKYEQAGSTVELMNVQRNISPWKLIYLLRNQFKKHQAEVVHVQYMAPGALPIVAARLAGVKTVFATVHQPYTPSHGKFSKLILRIASLLCTRFISVSINAEKSWFGNGQLFDENKPIKRQLHHFTIYNSIDAKRIQDITSAVNTIRLKQALAIRDDIPIIGAVSRLCHEKGIDLLIDAFSMLLQSNANAHLLVVGTGLDELKLHEMVYKNNLNSYVTFYGEADWETAMQLIAIMDVVVVPSRFEGFGLTAAEAMAAGKPVVASDVFGLKEVIVHNVSGFLFPVENTDLLKDLLLKLCNSQVPRKMLGDSGQKRAESVFGIDLFNKKISALYVQI